MEAIKWISANIETVIAIVTAVVTLASLVASVTPTPKDNAVIAKLYKGLQGLVKARKITYVEGEGRLTSPTTVEVNGQSYEGKHILLATGSYARSLPGLDIDGTKVITSDHAISTAAGASI